MMCIKIEAEPRIVKQYKCHHYCSCKNYWGKGMEGGKKSVFVLFFWLTRRSGFRGKLCLGPSYSTSNMLMLVAGHIVTHYGPPKMPLKSAV